MFRPYKRSNPFSLLDPDMWDTKSDFAAQTSRWCDTSTVSESESLSEASERSERFRRNDPSLQRWQSLSCLAPDNVTWPTSSLRAELRAARSQRIFPQMDVLLWLQDAQEHIDSQLDWFSTRDLERNNTASAHIFDSKQKLPSNRRRAQEQDATEASQAERSEDGGELHEKVLRLEKDLLQMRSALNNQSRDQAVRLSAPDLLNRTTANTQDNFDKQEKQKSDRNLSEMREAVREAEAKAAAYEEDGNKTLQRPQTAAETQRSMQNQMDEMSKRLSQTVQNHSEVRDQLSEANNKISQACLEKVILSTQVFKLEDNVRDLTAKLTAALSDRESLIQEKNKLLQRVNINPEGTAQSQELHEHLSTRNSQNNFEQQTFQMEEELKALREENQKLRGELQVVKQNLNVPKPYLQEHLKEQHSQTIREKEELLNERKEEEVEVFLETKDQCCQHRESVDVLEKEKQKLQEHLQLLENEVEEKKSRFLLQEEEHRKQDAARIQCIEKLKSVASHWAEKWQKVALMLKTTKDEFDEFKRNSSEENFLTQKDSDSLLRDELAACRQELEQERSRGQVLLQQLEKKEVELEQTHEKEQEAHFSDPPSIPFDSQSCEKKLSQVWIHSSDVEKLRKKLTEKERELSEKAQALRSLEKQRETERTESQMKISALELKLNQASEKCKNRGGLQAEDSLRLQLDESRKRAEQLEQEKMLVVQKLQALRQPLSVVKDDKPLVKGRKEETVDSVNPETERQRRLVTEQLKSLFRKQKEKEAEKVSEAAASQARASSSQDWTPSSSASRADRHYWHQGSGLVTLFEEDEERTSSTEEEEEETGEAHTEISFSSSEISSLRAKRLQKALRSKQPDQEAPTLDERTKRSDKCGLLKMSTTSMYPNGTFLAEIIDICSCNENEEDAELRSDAS